MSNPNPQGKLERFLDVLRPRDRRSRSSSPAVTTSGSTGRPGPSPSTTAPPPTTQTPALKRISLDDVLAELDLEQQNTIRQYCQQTSSEISISIGKAIAAAEEKKQLCIEKRWKMTVGTKTIVLRDKVDSVVSLVSKFKAVGSIAVGADPIHAGLPWAGVCLLLQIFVGQKEQMDALMNGMVTALSTQTTADTYHDFYTKQSAGLPADKLRLAIIKLHATVLSFLAEALRLWNGSGASRFWNALLGDGDLQKFPSRCREDLEDVERSATQCDRVLAAKTMALVDATKTNVIDILGQLESLRLDTSAVKTELDLAKLPIAVNAEFDCYDQQSIPTCLPNTRVDLLEDIARWVGNPADTCVFWLQGIAGEGKSTVAKTVATTLQAQNRLGASFFFKRDDSDRANARRFFTTVAAQLAQKIDGLKNVIAKVLDDEVIKYERSIDAQFEDLIANPLERIAQSSQTNLDGLIIVVDALDECFDGDVKLVLELLARVHKQGSFGIRTFVTGRPDVPVENAFSALEPARHRHVVLQDHTRIAIDHDISLFFKEQFTEIRSRVSDLHDDWPGQDMIQELTKRSVPLFIFAATVCKFIASDDFTPEEQLQAVLAESNSVGLARTYLPVLNRLVVDKSPKQATLVIDMFRNLVGPVVLAAEPMPVNLVMHMSGLDREQLKARLGRLNSVLHLGIGDGEMDHTIHPFHLSFRDFLLEPEEPHKFQIDERQAQTLATNACLAVMMESGKLQQNICAVSKPGTRRLAVDSTVIKSHIGPDLAYACLHWAHHQERSGVLLDRNQDVYSFLTEYFLYWFEAMAWLGKANEVLHAVEKLLRLGRAESSIKCVEFLEDAYCFARDVRYVADLAPSQLYVSALVFAPASSVVKSCFRTCMPQWLLHPPEVPNTLDQHLFVLHGHTRIVTAIAFSPDDKYLATCSGEDTLRVWETTTGVCTAVLSTEVEGHEPVAVAFSSSNDRVAVAFANWALVRLFDQPYNVTTYDLKSGTKLQTLNLRQCKSTDEELILGVNWQIRLAFTPESNDTLIAVFWEAGTLNVCRVGIRSNNCEQLWRIGMAPHDKDGLEYPLPSLAISPDVSLVLCSLPCKMRIASWQIYSGSTSKTYRLEEPINGFLALRGTELIYETESRGMQLLQRSNTQSRPANVFVGGKHSRTLFAVSHASDELASSFGNDVAEIRRMSLGPDVESQVQVPVLPRHIKVASDGESILAEYADHLEVLDTCGNLVFRTPAYESQTFGPFSVRASISSDGNVIIVHLESEMRLWVVKLKRERTLPVIKSLSGVSPAISNDGRSIVLCTYRRLLLWDLERNQESRSIDVEDFDRIRRVCFSEDDQILRTNVGAFDLRTCQWSVRGRLLSQSNDDDEPQPMSLSFDNQWVRFHKEDVLWLPPQYRHYHFILGMNSNVSYSRYTIAIVCHNGPVMVLKFADRGSPYWSAHTDVEVSPRLSVSQRMLP